MAVDYSAVAGVGFWLKEKVLINENTKEILQSKLPEGTILEEHCNLFEEFQKLFAETEFSAEEVGSRAYKGDNETKYYKIMVVLTEPFLGGFNDVPRRLQLLRSFLMEKGFEFEDTEDEDCLLFDVLVD